MSAAPGLDCDQVVELVTDYLEGALDAGLARRVEQHLAGCDGCDLYLEQLRVTVRALGAVTADDLAPQARDGLLDAFRTFRRER
jgi:anti-sigma factor RsiW